MTFEEWFTQGVMGLPIIATDLEKMIAKGAWNAALDDAIIDTRNHAKNLAAEGLTEIAEVLITRAEDLESLKA